MRKGVTAELGRFLAQDKPKSRKATQAEIDNNVKSIINRVELHPIEVIVQKSQTDDRTDFEGFKRDF